MFPRRHRSHDAGSTALAGEVAALTRAGRALPSGLRALAEEAPPRTARSLTRLAEEVEAGRSLEEALAEPAVGLPGHIVALLEAGRRGGDVVSPLAGVLGEASLSTDLRRRIQVGLVYPAVLLGSGLLLMAALCGFILGKVHEVFRDFGISLPWISAQILAMGARLAGDGAWFLLALPGIAVLTALMVRLLLTPEERRRVLLAVPVIGPVGRYAAAASLCRVLAALLDAHLPLPEALRLAGPAAGDPLLNAACERAAGRVEAGVDLSAVAADELFPRGFGAFAAWAQRSGDPADALRLAAAIFEARARTQASHAVAFLKVLALVAISWWVLIAVVVVLVPSLQLISALSA